LMAVGVAGCSSDMTRFSDNPFSSPYSSRTAAVSHETTGATASVQPGRTGQVESQSLPPPGSDSTRGMATDNPGHNRSDVTGAVSSTHAAGRSNWSWQGGTAVMVEQGETLDSISKRYGVPASAIMQANAMTGPASLQPGQRLVIPRYTQNGAPNLSTPSTRIASNSTTIPSTTGTNFSSKPVHVPTATAGVHVVAPGETLSSIARLYGKPRTAVAKS